MNFYIVAQQLVNGLVLGTTYGLIAVGYTMVYGIIGMINFAHGDVYMVAAYLTAIIIASLAMASVTQVGAVIMLTLLICMAVTGALGWLIERVAYRPLRQSTRLAPLISAIGMSLFLQNFVALTQGARNQAVPTLITQAWQIGDNEHFFQITALQCLLIGVSIAAMLGLHFLIQKTSLGRACRATQEDRVMAEILGIPTNRIISIVFVIGAVMAAVAGVLITLNYGSFDFFIGFKTGVKAFTAAVLGGIGSLPGAMLGGIILGLAESLFAGFVNSDYKDVFAFSLLIVVLVFKPSGFLGRPEVEKV